jgi:capsid protein
MSRETLNPTMAEAFETLRGDYSAAKSSRFRRRRTGTSALGSGADWHLRNESDYLRMMEDARDMDRNDVIVGQILDRAVSNTIQDGFVLDPDTGDPAANQDLKGRWLDWATEPDLCDLAGECSFWDYEKLSLRNCHADGDICILPNQSGRLEAVEAHRLRTPKNTTLNVVCGVKRDPATRRHLEYWFTKEDVNPLSPVNRVNDIRKYAARDAEGFKQVWHILVSQKRFSQTRGITALAPIFDLCGMFEDINFATLVKHQVASCFAIFEELDNTFPNDTAGTASQNAQAEGQPTESVVKKGVEMMLRGMAPGMFFKGKQGSKYRLDSPKVPSPEFFPHVKLILTLIGINLGLPLVMVLMDASETNFSGWRGAVDQARMGFRDRQFDLKAQLHRPCYVWKVRQWLAQDPALRAIAEKSNIKIFRHHWSTPTWPYIQPYQDAAADLLRIRNALISRRRQCAERNLNWDRLSTEITEDNAMMIEKAHLKAVELHQKYPELEITWREIASLPSPDGVNVSLQPDAQQNQSNGRNGQPAE